MSTSPVSWLPGATAASDILDAPLRQPEVGAEHGMAGDMLQRYGSRDGPARQWQRQSTQG